MPDYFLPGRARKKPVEDDRVSLTGIGREDTIFAAVFTIGMLIAAVIRFQGLVWQYYRPMQIF